MTLSILIIDDIPSHRQHFQHILLQLGIYTLVADSAEQGLKLLETTPVNTILLDYNMPGMNGFEFIKEYRSRTKGQDVPIIMMSSDLAINELALKQGLAQAWVTKRATRTMVENALKSLGLITV